MFRSAHYFLSFGGMRVRLPAWATPGALCVTHANQGEGRFVFTLDLTHRWLGALIRQSVAFKDPAS